MNELTDKFYNLFNGSVLRRVKELNLDDETSERLRLNISNNKRRKTLPRPYVIEAFKDYFDEDTYAQMYIKSYREYHNPNDHETELFVKLKRAHKDTKLEHYKQTKRLIYAAMSF
ncbi:hypothetical protein [Streptococcus agalactiae]|uniref:hypothetical protein n=1 Tax=Streptococcus agalactiae TaxID=1311 RepID=UPI0002E4C85A|nr:hypothetical protein [Streptococcus agalactiae]MCQ3827709.1 hypothetical protein [Streptococcus agalactiae]